MKNKLSKYLKLVRTGQDFIITDHGRPVARLTVAGVGTPTEAEAVTHVEALPWVLSGRRAAIKGLREEIALEGKGSTASDIVLEDRD